jgi:hypothetical protein
VAELRLRSLASVQVVEGSTGNTKFSPHTFYLHKIERRGDCQAESEANDREESCGSLWKLDLLLTAKLPLDITAVGVKWLDTRQFGLRINGARPAISNRCFHIVSFQ